jgi:hypothetical protein
LCERGGKWQLTQSLGKHGLSLQKKDWDFPDVLPIYFFSLIEDCGHEFNASAAIPKRRVTGFVAIVIPQANAL